MDIDGRELDELLKDFDRLSRRYVLDKDYIYISKDRKYEYFGHFIQGVD